MMRSTLALERGAIARRPRLQRQLRVGGDPVDVPHRRQRHADGLAAEDHRLDDPRDAGALGPRGPVEDDPVADPEPRLVGVALAERDPAVGQPREDLVARGPSPVDLGRVELARTRGARSRAGARRSPAFPSAPAGSARRGSARARARRSRAASRAARPPRFEIVCCGPSPGENPAGRTERSRAKARSNSDSIESRKLAPRLLTATTSASPIIRPVAVAAVRPGSERAESAARRPATGEARRSGQASTRTSGLITNGAIIAIPKKIAIVPLIPAAATSGVVSSAAPSKKAPARPEADQGEPGERAAAARARAQALGAEHGADRGGLPRPAGGQERAEEGRCEAADDGGRTRAGPRRQRRPTGKSSPSRISLTRPSASSTPRPSPSTQPTTPSASASRRTARTTIGRVAPRVRSMPSSRVRWSTVMLKALKIRKPPTKRAIAAKK